jgi:hypothetical protein
MAGLGELEMHYTSATAKFPTLPTPTCLGQIDLHNPDWLRFAVALHQIRLTHEQQLEISY